MFQGGFETQYSRLERRAKGEYRRCRAVTFLWPSQGMHSTIRPENRVKRMLVMNALCHTALHYFASGTPLVLATMMDQQGSVPRTAGARMLVLPGGGIWGTVGGGRYEAEAIAAAMDLHAKAPALPESGPEGKRPGYVLEYSLRGVTDMDMICGGALTLLLEYLPPSRDMRRIFALGKEAEQAGESFVFISRFTRSAEAFFDSKSGGLGETLRQGRGRYWRAEVERFSLPFQGGQLEPHTASMPMEAVRAARAHAGSAPHHMELEGVEYLLEQIPQPYRLVLFGGGHVSRAVAALAHNVDFHTTVVDDRQEFANAERFPDSRVRVLPSLGEEDCSTLLADFKTGDSDGLVIVTRGHSHDREALAAALKTRAGYIGMIGSRSKRAAVYASLRDAGVSQERLDAVHSPIGLAIGAETPEEIAVSIVGELIQWRKHSRDARDGNSGTA